MYSKSHFGASLVYIYTFLYSILFILSKWILNIKFPPAERNADEKSVLNTGCSHPDVS